MLVARSIDADATVAVLERLVAERTHSGGQGPGGSSVGAGWPWRAAVIVASR
jgi:hypothetical protein